MSTMAEQLAWHEQAACRDHDRELWLPKVGESPARVAKAKRICREQCPVRSECLEYALSMEGNVGHNSRFHIWGGYGPRGRWQIYRCRAGLCQHTVCPVPT